MNYQQEALSLVFCMVYASQMALVKKESGDDNSCRHLVQRAIMFKEAIIILSISDKLNQEFLSHLEYAFSIVNSSVDCCRHLFC